MNTVMQEQDARPGRVLPPGVQDALGELAGAAKDGLLALSVGVGLGVLSEMMEAELDEVVGAKHANNAQRTAVRHGHTDGEVTLGGRRIAVKRPRARTADGEQEVPLATYEYFADRDPLTRVVLEQMLAGVSTRRFSRTREPVGEQVSTSERSASKSAVSREFVGRTREHLDALMSRDLADVRLAALMVDGVELKGRCCIVALGVSTDGVKLPLGLWDGSTENKTVTAHLLADLIGRGLDVEQGVLVVLDGSKALRAAVDEVFGPVPVQRCVRHKERNVLEHLPERDRPAVKARLRRAWASDNHALALDGLRALACRARTFSSRGGEFTQRGLGGDPDPHPPGNPRTAEEDLGLDEPDRVDDRDHPTHLPQRQALAKRGHVPPLDRRGDARGRDPIPEGRRLLRSREARPRRRTRPRCAARTHSHHDPRGGTHARQRVTITPPTATTNFHGERDNLSMPVRYVGRCGSLQTFVPQLRDGRQAPLT